MTRVDIPCRIEIEHSDEFLCAHVVLPDGTLVHPGDRVRVHGAPIEVGFGHRVVIERTATIARAGPIARAWTRLVGHFAMTELYEVSFSPRRLS